MNPLTFLWDKMLSVMMNAAGIVAVGVFVGITARLDIAMVIIVCWTAIAVFYYAVSYILQKKRIKAIRVIADETEDKFLLGEIVPEPRRIEDRLYYELMLLQGRAAIDRVQTAAAEQAEYYDYIQEWVHEVKMPLTVISLICNRNDSEDFREIARQAAKLDDYAEQALYEAKSGGTEKDTLIRKVEVARVVNECVRENKRLFIDSGIAVETDLNGWIYTDEKWLGFILKQILQNSRQYRSDNAVIRVESHELPDGRFEIAVWDNGIGIAANDLPRVFDKGFTGGNGRRNKKSTGMGLYLCKKLCGALDAEISASSVIGEYTRISIVFANGKTDNLTKP